MLCEPSSTGIGTVIDGSFPWARMRHRSLAATVLPGPGGSQASPSAGAVPGPMAGADGYMAARSVLMVSSTNHE